MLARAVTTRRTALGGAFAGLLAVGGCELDPRTDDAPENPTDGQDDPPDTVLVDDVLLELDALVTLLVTARREHPELREPLRPLLALHREHAAALGGRDPRLSVRARRTARGTPDVVLGQISERERRAQRRLVDAAMAARSGAVAQLFASMSAAVAQQLVRLPSAPRTETS